MLSSRQIDACSVSTRQSAISLFGLFPNYRFGAFLTRFPLRSSITSFTQLEPQVRNKTNVSFNYQFLFIASVRYTKAYLQKY
jgi:hypothetical protein